MLKEDGGERCSVTLGEGERAAPLEPSKFAETVLKKAFNGAIALMHNGGGNRQQNIEALLGIIDGLHDAGCGLVTVSELMRLDGTFPEDVVKGTVKMPEDAAMPAV